MRFEIRRQIYRKSINELSGNWYTDEQYRKYEIYDTKKESRSHNIRFAEIEKEKEIGNE